MAPSGTPYTTDNKRMRGRVAREQADSFHQPTTEEKGIVLRPPNDVGSDEEIVEAGGHKDEVWSRYPRRLGAHRRASCIDGIRAPDTSTAAGAGSGAFIPYDHPRDNRGSAPSVPHHYVRGKFASGQSRRCRGSSGPSSSSSSLPSSTEEESNCSKMRRKKWSTAAHACVATIRIASKVHSSIESHDKSMEDVENGDMSSDTAHSKLRASRWQDAVAIGVTALGIKGAMSEWKQVKGEHDQHKELITQRHRHHKKRVERERRSYARED